MFDPCKSNADCSGTVVVSYCETLAVSYDTGTSTESFCTEGCNNPGGSCLSASYNGQLAYCAGVNGAGTLTTGPAARGICLERCSTNNDCNFGYLCVDNKFADIDFGVRVCVPGPNITIPPTIPYDFCVSDAECDPAAPSCDQVSAKWVGEVDTYIANICTDGCKADVDCPNVIVGGETYLGRCVPPGSVGSLATCVQGCLQNSDCILGFDCADSDEFDGADLGYPICVPHGDNK